MSKELKTGDWCYAGELEDKRKRIYLGTFEDYSLCIAEGYEDFYLIGEKFAVCKWDEVHPIEDQQEFSYPMWFKDTNSELVVRFDGLTCGEVIIGNYAHDIGTCIKIWNPHTDTKEWTQIPEPKIFYKWEYVDLEFGWIRASNYVTDEFAIKWKYFEDGWTKIEQSRRVV